MKAPQKRRKWPRRIAIALVLILALSAVDYFGYPYGNALSGKSFDQGENGLWLRYTWYFGSHSSSEVDELCRRLTREQMRYAYFHVRFVQKDGHLRFHYPKSAQLTQQVHRAASGVKAIAWIYVDGDVPIGEPRIRAQMVGEAKWLVVTCGFDGIQWDFEPCPDGSKSFLALLDDTRSALPKAFLSVDAPTWFPWPAGGFGWSETYFGEVGKRCDQIAVMCYDTGFVLPRSYAWLVGQQAERIPKDAPMCQVLLGLPAYEDGGRSHNPRAENLQIALKAVRESGGVAGISLFADYTMDESKWAWYERAWLGR